VAVLAQIAVVAAGTTKYSVLETYGAEGCAEADLKQKNIITTDSLLEMMQAEAGYSFGGCMNKSESGLEMSQKLVCDGGFLSVKTYLGSDACAEASIYENATFLFDCKKDDEKEKWTSIACEADMSGYVEISMAMHGNSSDCSSTATSMTMMRKLGDCNPDSDLNEGTWTSKSSKMSISDGVVTNQDFSNADCSGTASESVEVTCGECSSTGDDSYIIITCPPPGGPGDASGAFQPSRTLSMLALLAVGAVKADLPQI